MAFDVGAGLAQLGETAGKFAGLAALEQQKSGLETERLKLANDLAMTRESAGRQEQHALDIDKLGKVQAFEAGENEKNRATTLEAHRISAGASVAAAGMHLQAAREQIAAMERQPDYKVADDGTLLMIPKKVGVGGSVTATPVLDANGAPQKVANPDKAKAQAELLTTTRTQVENLYHLYSADLKQAQADLTQAQKSPESITNPKIVEDARKAVEDVRARYQPKIEAMTNRMNALYNELGVKAQVNTGAAPAGAPSLDTFLRMPTAPAAPSTPPAGSSGLINTGNF